MYDPTPLLEEIGRQRLSIAELARKANVTRQTIYNVLEGGNTTTETLESVVKVLGYKLFFAK